LVVGGSIMILLGFVGIYIGFIFQEVKGRPIYITRSKTIGLKEDDAPNDADDLSNTGGTAARVRQ